MTRTKPVTHKDARVVVMNYLKSQGWSIAWNLLTKDAPPTATGLASDPLVREKIHVRLYFYPLSVRADRTGVVARPFAQGDARRVWVDLRRVAENILSDDTSPVWAVALGKVAAGYPVPVEWRIVR